MILEVYYRKGKEFVAIIAARGGLGEKKGELDSRNVRKGKIGGDLYKYGDRHLKKFDCRLRRAEDE